jgi:hypothetical protein
MKNKVILVYKDIEGEIAEETIWVKPENGNYKIDNIPFYAPNLALNDIISVENDDGVFYFDELIKPSGHSTLQIIFFKEKEIIRVMKIIEQMNCKWEGMENQPYFAIDVPPKVNYNEIKKFLNNELDNKVLDFKEACLGENHI